MLDAKHVVMLLLDPYERDARVEKEAASLVRAGFRVTVLAWNRFGTSKEREERDGAAIERVTALSPSGSKWRILFRYPRVYWWFFRRALALRYDLLLAHEMYSWPLAWLLRLLTGRPAIFDAHEPYAEALMGILPSLRRFRPLLLAVEGFLIRRGDVVLTVTPKMMERCRRLRVQRLVYLPNVPPLENPAGAPAQPDPARLTLGRVGSITRRYSGVEPIIEVTRVLRSRGIPVRAVIGGPVMAGWSDGLKELVASCDGSVEYIGVVPVKQVRGVVAGFDVMLSLRELDAPKAEYGYSSKIFDAMAAGVPVISTPAGEDPALVQETGCGEVVDYPVNAERLADRLLELWRDPVRRRQYGESGVRAMRERYHWEAFEAALVGVVREMAGAGQRASTPRD